MYSNNFNKEALVAAHYITDYPDHLNKMQDWHVASYQKVVWGGPYDRDKLFFIEITHWKAPGHIPLKYPNNEGWEAEVCLYLEDGKDSFRITYNVDRDTTIIGVEKFFRDAYHRLMCCPDIHNND